MNSCAIPAELSRFPRILVTTSYLNREWLVAHHDWRKKINETSRIPPNKKKSIRGDSGDSWPVWNRGITRFPSSDRQSLTLILSTNIHWKSLETEYSIAICCPTDDTLQSKTLFLAIFDVRSSIVKSVFDCRLSGMWFETQINGVLAQ